MNGWRTAKRPGVDYFLAYMAQFYEIVIFTTQHYYVRTITAPPLFSDGSSIFVSDRLTSNREAGSIQLLHNLQVVPRSNSVSRWQGRESTYYLFWQGASLTWSSPGRTCHTSTVTYQKLLSWTRSPSMCILILKTVLSSRNGKVTPKTGASSL